MKILVIQQKMIGDVLLSTLLCENIKKWNPSVEIDFIANKHTTPVLQNNPFIDRIIIFGDDFKKDKKLLIKFLYNQNKTKYDIIIDAYGKIESILTTWLTPAKIKIGYNKWYTKFIYSKRIDRQTIRLKNDIQLSIKNRLKLLGTIVGNDFDYVHKPKIYLNDIEKRNTKLILNKKNKNLLLMISALGSSKLKTYPIKKMSTLLDYLVEKYNAQLILNYMPSQKEEISILFDKINSKTRKALLIKKAPVSLREFILMTSVCDATIGNEGGAINISKSLNIPTFAIFSPQIDPEVWNTSSPDEIGVHIKSYNKNFNNFNLNNKEINHFYESFNFDYFIDELSIFMNRL